MTHLPRDLTQIRHAQLPLYPGVESASNSAAVSRQHLADLVRDSSRSVSPVYVLVADLLHDSSRSVSLVYVPVADL